MHNNLFNIIFINSFSLIILILSCYKMYWRIDNRTIYQLYTRFNKKKSKNVMLIVQRYDCAVERMCFLALASIYLKKMLLPHDFSAYYFL